MKIFNKKSFVIILALLMLTLTACGKSSFGLTENTEKHMTITAERAAADAFFMVGSLEVEEGEQIVISAALTKGSIRVEIVGPAEEQSIDTLPETDSEAIITALFESNEGTSATMSAGSYLLRATCLKTATGTIEIEVKPADEAAAEPVEEPAGEPAEEPAAEPAEEPAAEPARQDGERFETVIILEGMEETVRYEHLRNEALGFEMDYDYESFVRRSEADRECFISIWDDPQKPENYLEITRSADDADTVAESVRAALSEEYDLLESTRELDGTGNCLRIEASEIKGTGQMADQLQVVYIIPADDGCVVATAHYAIEAAEGFGRRFSYLMNTLELIGR